MEAEGFSPTSVGADQNYHNGPFVAGCRADGIKPHVASITGRKVPGLDGRTTGSPGYQISQTIRKRAEQIFGWMRTVGGVGREQKAAVSARSPAQEAPEGRAGFQPGLLANEELEALLQPSVASPVPG